MLGPALLPRLRPKEATNPMISQTGQYALRAVLYLARQPNGGYSLARDVAEAVDVPQHYLCKVLQALSRARVLESQRGVNGGFRLARSPSDVTLLQVLEPVQDVFARGECLLGRRRCNVNIACGLHGPWTDLIQQYHAFLEDTTVEDLVGALATGDRAK